MAGIKEEKTMWKCPNCETINEDEKCFICGTPKSAAIARQEEEKSLPLPPPPRKPEDFSRASSETSKGENSGYKWGYLMLAVAAVIFLAVCLTQCS